MPFFLLEAEGSRATQIYSFASGINKEAFILVADLGEKAVLIIRRPGKEGDPYLRLLLQKEEDFERAAGVLRRLDLVSDSLTAHANLSEAVELLRVGAERYFVNLGLFSNYFLRERMIPHLSERGRHINKESTAFFSGLGGEIPTDPQGAKTVLSELGYKPMLLGSSAHPEYRLLSGSVKLDAICVLTKAESLDTKKSEEVVPSYQAVSALKQAHWVILTNGRLWRLYSSRVSSSSTNYFEIDLDGITSESDPKLAYFTSLFSAASLAPKPQGSDLETVFEGGLKYAQDIRDELSRQVFEGQLFLNLVRGVISHNPDRSYKEHELEEAKATALRLLYRILFVLYAESRNLLPTGVESYDKISLESLRQRLVEFEKRQEGTELWLHLKVLFRSIEKGNVEAEVPVYDGELFKETADLDERNLKNKYLIPALRELTEINGKGIDYHDLGVRHLGSLYEALLEYSVYQAEEDLVVYKDGTLDAAYAADMKAKPEPYVSKGELYLSAGGLARKGTGSYYTPDELVRFLTENGLQPIFESRQLRFEAHIKALNMKHGRDPELERTVIDDLLGIKVVDPAMGSGHFLVSVVDQITGWIMDRLKEHPEAPLARIIDEDRAKVISDQKEKGIEIRTDLLTDNVILKRLVMKQCVYGVDVNPLAVELAKLSLWLDSFTIGTPLTFLDHHIRCGDSLIGLWLSNISDRAFERTLDSWIGTLSEGGAELFEFVSMPADLTVEQVERSRRAYDDIRERTTSLRMLLDLQVAGVLDPELGKRLPRNLMLIKEIDEKNQARPSWWSNVENALRLAHDFKAFHWEFEFLDAFQGSDKGFDLVITNPPWETVMPEDDDFFSTYYPHFRTISSKPEKKKVIKTLLERPELAQSYTSYVTTIEKRVNFFKNSQEFQRRGSGHTNLWKLFLERAMNLAKKEGSLAVVLPSSIVTDEGAKQLRQALFSGKIRLLYEFENALGVFGGVDKRFKFVLLAWDKAGHTETFPAAFYLHDVQSLEGKKEQEKFLTMPLKLVSISSPESLSIPEVRGEEHMRIIMKLYSSHTLLGDETKGWNVSLVQELNGTSDSDLFRTDGRGWPFIDGKNFHQYLPDFEKPTFTITPELGLQRTARHADYRYINSELHKEVRLAFRRIASSTNVRTVVACLLPPDSFFCHNAVLVLPKSKGRVPRGAEYSRIVAYLTGVFNSFVFDFLVRTKVSITLNSFYILQTPIPYRKGDYLERILSISARLSCPDERFRSFANRARVEVGPLTMKERVNLTAELNALVAKQYGLTRKELEFVLGSFDGFEEDETILTLVEQPIWSDDMVRKFNGEVRKLVPNYFNGE